METQEIAEVVRLHGLWLADQEGGKRADLTEADLRGADLTRANLNGAILRGADLTRANLNGADLPGADLTEANLTRANLNGAYLRGADLTRADLIRAYLCGANLCGANLTGANLRGANLTDADLTEAILTGADLSGAILRGADLTRADLTRADLTRANLTRADLYGAILPPLKITLPEGDFTAYKKVRDGVVLTLLIPADAKRTGSLVGRKCRADRAKVVSSSVEGDTFRSLWDYDFIYTVGEVVTEPNYSGDTRVECTRGVHFFLTREEAEAFTF